MVRGVGIFILLFLETRQKPCPPLITIYIIIIILLLLLLLFIFLIDKINKYN